jgi:predicted TPR repeat methyltransferase
MSSVKNHYDRVSELYETLMHISGHMKATKKLLAEVEFDLPMKPRILDMGCGTGLGTQVLRQRFPQASITGLDYSEKMLRIYRKRYPENKIVFGDFNNPDSFRDFTHKRPVSLNEGMFDLVISTAAVTEYGQLDRLIPYIYRILGDEGCFFSIGVRKRKLNILSSKIWHLNTITVAEYMKKCEQAGFGKVRRIQIGAGLFPSNLLKFSVLAKK